MAHKRTGLRKPKHFLKDWGSRDWTKQLTPRLRVGMVDEWLPFGKEGGRKSWYLSLTQKPDLLTTLRPVKGAPTDGKTLLLFEDDVVALAQHLVDRALVIPTETGRVVNGPAWDWEEVPKLLRKKLRRRKRKATS